MVGDSQFVTWLQSLSGSEFRLGMVLAFFAIVIVAVSVATAWTMIRKAEYRTRLTAALLQRGLRTEEIERVLRAAYADAAAPPSCGSKIEPGDEPEVRIVKHLSSCSYDGNDIDKVLKAARETLPIDEACVRMVEAMASNWVDADEIAKVLQNRRPGRAGEAAGPAAGWKVA